MTVQIEWGGQEVSISIHGDIYEEQAQCLSDIVYSHVQRGIRVLEVNLGTTYYISKQGTRCLQRLLESVACQGVRLSFTGKCDCVNCLSRCMSARACN